MPNSLLKNWRVLSLLGLLSTSCLAGEESTVFDLSLEELLSIKVSTATKQRETTKQAPSTVYLITEQDIRSNGYFRLQDVLENIPGINPVNLDFFAFGGVRGFLGNFSQTLILINGREVQNLIAAETFISEQFATNNIEQIEIINGPGSVLYGANAMLGVINVKTKTASNHAEPWLLSVDIGSEDKRGVSLSGAHKKENWRFAVSARYHETSHWDHGEFVRDTERFSEGFPAIVQNSHNIDNLGYNNSSRVRSLSFEVDYKDFYFGAESFYLTTGKGLENVALNYDGQFDVRKFRMFYGGWSHQFDNNSTVTVDFKDYRERFWGRNYFFKEDIFNLLVADGRDPTLPFSPNEVRTYFTDIYSQQTSDGSSRQKLDIQFETMILNNWSLVTGYTYDEQDILGIALNDIDQVPPFDERISLDNPLHRPYYQTEEHSAFIQLRKDFWDNKLSLTLAGRYDNHSIYDSTSSIRSGFVYRHDKDTTIKVLYGEAFREPNIFEQGAQNPPDVPPNLDLQPADIDTWELSLHQQFGNNVSANFTLFNNNVENLIIPVTTFNFTNSNNNISVIGLESLIRYEYEKVSGDIAYTWLDPDDTIVGTRMENHVNTPEHRLSAGINFNLSDSIHFNTRLNWYDHINAEHGNPSIEEIFQIESATKIDFNFYLKNIWPGDNNATLMIGIKNVFNETWYQPNVRNGGPKQFLQPGRQWQLRYEWQF